MHPDPIATSQHISVDFRQLQQSDVFADYSHFQHYRSTYIAWSPP